ncbi:Phosphoinositide phosphatase sac1 [Friedmanniomyces endolithicus]|uniref:Phosphoinositide phosphatase sac1 n=1 Tax=Friedmanniomyces endolithicus TaxID=329885 RepID=A0AAN6KGR2_9PEZI|nr:Phosphoinositide phosphatase sac1 [Friedmanniomyces endolithicus]KAK0787642.1 Phosphoinositide phosphatase sac1 [Friedmanniomyces endolithicus]KAK0788988.1 Phosphoinositide phosphatase sac1 [Friedmanniomyces endolithicus]KAK0793651.1 Phosphoinositide phosphatase sac1 [Friedmanniomyces endolithicus]KAK0846682.1 Phosphoinositide phosphatase sac1 [Friedmanniomyces endolithicus]
MSATLPFRDINVHASSTYYAFSSPSSPNAPTLVIDRPSGDLRLNNGKLTGGHRVSSISGILGIVKLRLDSYVIAITKSQPMGRIKGHQIYKVISTEFMPLRERQLTDPDEQTYLTYLKASIKSGPMYFSYSFDLTNSYQRQAQCDPNQPLWQRADDRFFWNRFVCNSLVDFREGKASGRMSAGPQPAVDAYILPVMYGMMNITGTSVKGNALSFVLITRRSRYRAGTRYMSRGIDEQGHVSNFNETEQMVIMNDSGSAGLTSFTGDQSIAKSNPVGGKEAQVLSYVQTRGSVPVFWAEINNLHYVPTLQIRSAESAKEAASRHFDEQIRLYGENYLVNLVNQKGREVRVKNAYEEVTSLLQSSPSEKQEASSRTNERSNVMESSDKRGWYDHLHYVYFDFHNETKGLKWHRAQLLLDQLKDGLVAGGYFHGIDRPSGGIDVRRQQTAVVRTNCMDCLDRTNVVQSMLGRWTLTRQLIDLGVLKSGESAQDDQAFENLFRNVWADNADVVSRSYSGTGALKTDFTRTGNRTRAGALQDMNSSITRYVRNNFSDGPRQDGFDLFLGAYQPDGAPIESGQQFVDRRPLLVQAVPYLLGFCVFLVVISLSTTRVRDSTVWPLRLFTLLSTGVAGWSGRFMWTYGSLYVNWPKLNTPQWAIEAYEDTLNRVRKDPVVGRFVGGGKGDARLGTLEEGKKRRE